jgi:hypothetical protein
VSGRSTRRILTALLLVLSAFGVPDSSFTLVRFASAIVCAVEHQPSRPQRIGERCSPAPVPRRTVLKPAPLLERPRDLFVRGPLFQRPPPSLFFSLV